MDEDQPLGQIGPYRLLSVLGEGGMGTVYLAEQREPMRRRVALKVIKAGMDSKEVVARFEAERRALSMMEHSCIAAVFDCGLTAEGRPFFVMEHVKGIPITDYCDQNRLSFEDRLALFRKVCSGVQHAHMKGIMHRDLKPSNVLVTLQDGDPTPKIIDFGLAKATNHHLVEQTVFTQYGMPIGTPEYMSPEQAGLGGLDVDTRTDVYSLGVLLYHLLVGELPFPRHKLLEQGYLEMQRVIREQEPEKPSTKITSLGEIATKLAESRRLDRASLRKRLTGDMDWIVLKALEKDRTRRYQTPLEMAGDLDRYLRLEPVLAGPPSVAYRLRKFVARNRTRVAVATAVAVSLLAGLLVATTLYFRAQSYLDTLTTLADNLSSVATIDAGIEKLQTEWRPRPEHRAAVQEWIDAAQQFLPRVVRLMDELPSDLAMAGKAGPLEAFLQQTKERLGASVDRLGSATEALATARRRLVAIDTAEQSAAAALPAWTKVQEELRADPRFAGLDLPPQRGLVPLGRDPASGLQEFAHAITGAIPSRDPTGQMQFDANSALVLVLLPGGRCKLGNQAKDPAAPHYDPLADSTESPVVEVRLDPFFVGKHEVAQDSWFRMMGNDPSTIMRGSLHPVETVSWLDVQGFLTATDLELPTEAQWEYACRAGTATPWFTGAHQESLLGYANLADLTAKEEERATWDSLMHLATWPTCKDGHARTTEVSTLAPNPFGLHHIVGNLFELCSDGWVDYINDGKVLRADGTGALPAALTSKSHAGYRGGSYRCPPTNLRSASRFWVERGSRMNHVGFRVARRIER